MSRRTADSEAGRGSAASRRRWTGVTDRSRSEGGRSLRSVKPTTDRRSGGTNSPSTYGRSALSISGVAVLTATKMADALTTGVGLRFVPAVYEANPVVDSLLSRVGIVTGLLVSSFAIVVAITVITEVASIAVSMRRRDGHLAPIVRLTGYGIPSALFAVVAVYNATIVVAGLRAVELF